MAHVPWLLTDGCSLKAWCQAKKYMQGVSATAGSLNFTSAQHAIEVLFNACLHISALIGQFSHAWKLNSREVTVSSSFNPFFR